MPITNPGTAQVLLINTFTVEPAKAEKLVTVLSRATQNGMQKRAGFISANLHVSNDKRHVANYAEWRSQADIDSMMQDPEARSHMKAAADIADAFEPIYYELRESFEA